MNFPNSINQYEDDEDKAPTFNLTLEGNQIFSK